MIRILVGRLAPFHRAINTTGGLVLATAVNNGSGFIFWWIAAQRYPAEAVGLAGAAVSAMLLLSQISMLGLGTTLAGVLHREPRAASLAVTAMIAASGAGAVLGLGFALLGPAISAELQPIAESWQVVILFAVGVSITTFSALLDPVLVSTARNLLQLLRNVIFSVSRLVFLLVAAALLASAGMVLYGVWIASTVFSLVVIGSLVHRARLSGDIRPLVWRQLGGMASDALSHHILNLSRSSSVWLLPLLVTIMLSREANASFYVALLLANFVALVGTSATFTLYVIGAQEPERLWQQLRFTMGVASVSSLAGTAVLTAGGGLLLTAFGDRYASEAYPTVALLAASTLPLAVKDHWIAIHRVRGSVRRGAVVGVMALALEISAAAYGAALAGIEGLALARLAVLVLEAAFMARTVVSSAFPSAVTARSTGPRGTPSAGTGFSS